MPAADAEDRGEEPDAARHALARELVTDDPEGQREDAAARALDDAPDDHRACSDVDSAETTVPTARMTSVMTSSRSLPYMSPRRPRIDVATDADSR